MKKNKNIEKSSGNVYKDLGFKNPGEWLAKAELAIQISDLIEKKNINQSEAAQLLNIDQPKISALATGKLDGFSIERLFRFLNILSQSITIKIAPKTRSKKNATVSVITPKKRTSLNILNDLIDERKSIQLKKRK